MRFTRIDLVEHLAHISREGLLLQLQVDTEQVARIFSRIGRFVASCPFSTMLGAWVWTSYSPWKTVRLLKNSKSPFCSSKSKLASSAVKWIPSNTSRLASDKAGTSGSAS